MKNKKAIIIITLSILVLLIRAPWMNKQVIHDNVLQQYGKTDGSIDKNGNLFCDYEVKWLPFGRAVVSCEDGYFVPFFYFKKANNDNAQEQQVYENNKITNETSGWKTYKNEKYGFEFKYPEKLKLSQSKDTVSLDEENFIINIYPEKFIIDWKVKETCPGEQIGDTRLLRRVIVNGADMPLCFDDSQKDTNLSGIVFYKILIPKEKNQTKANVGEYLGVEAQVYGSLDNASKLKVFDQILSSFKFTD